MTQDARTIVWCRLGDAAKALGDAVATPGGAAPDRAVHNAAKRRDQY
jgi:hypothetical protein